MKTLQNALDVLEFVAGNGGMPVTPSAAAEAVGLNLSSCTRMMQDLAGRGYLAQISRRGGYLLGPAAATYGGRPSKYVELSEAAREPMRQFAREIRAMATLSLIHNDRRYILLQCGYTEGIQPSHSISTPWNYQENATERLLLSAAGFEERRRILRMIGIPAGFAEREFLEELDRLAAAGTVKFHSDRQKLWIGGGIVVTPGHPIAAIGFGVPTESENDRALELVKVCAEKIRLKFSPANAFPYC